MLLDKETLRFVFGLKLRSLRSDKGLSLKDLAKKTGLSPSYINEIEKGKKYPKAEKILSLANALDEKYENLISLELKKEFQLLQSLMDKRILTALPFDIFGIPANTVFDLLAERPKNMRALVGTLLEIARGHNIQIDDFLFALLRAYLDMHQNYFPTIEAAAKKFREEQALNIQAAPESLKQELLGLLKKQFKVKVIEEDLGKLSKDLEEVYYFITEDGDCLYLSNRLDSLEQIFILAREIGYRAQRLDARPVSSLVLQLDSFEQLFNHFSASYFASSLLIPEEQFIKDCDALLKRKDWSMAALEQLLLKYPCPVESVFHRFTQILPQHFGINQLFFLRFEYEQKSKKFEIARELHLSSMHGPHRVKGNEHYCSRWLISKLTQSVAKDGEGLKLGVQHSSYVDSENEYLIFGAAFKSPRSERKTASVCLGLLVNDNLQKKARFFPSPAIPHFTVGETCERCTLSDCSDRKAPLDPQLDPGRYDRVFKKIASLTAKSD